jgi:hypothetical protein
MREAALRHNPRSIVVVTIVVVWTPDWTPEPGWLLQVNSRAPRRVPIPRSAYPLAGRVHLNLVSTSLAREVEAGLNRPANG